MGPIFVVFFVYTPRVIPTNPDDIQVHCKAHFCRLEHGSNLQVYNITKYKLFKYCMCALN